MPDSRQLSSRRRFLAVSSLGLTAAALASRGINVRKKSLLAKNERVILPHEEVPIIAQNELPLPDSNESLLEVPEIPLTEPEAYAEFIASLGLRYITPREVIEPHWSDVNGISNQLPPRELWKKLPATLHLADEMRHRLGVPLLRITSAYRSPKYNSQIPGSARNSYHTRNQALDLVFACSARRMEQVARELRDEGFFKGGIGRYSTFLHVDTRGKNATWRKA